MDKYGSLPRARRDDLLEEMVGEELLLYDQNSHTAHCLSLTAASVWKHCDGEHDMTELAELTGASESLVADALHELREKELLDAESTLMEIPNPGISRREAIGRVARYGAGAAAGSLIVSATAATPAMAASCKACGELCHTKAEGFRCCCCCDGQCITIASSKSCETECKNAMHGAVQNEANEMSCG